MCSCDCRMGLSARAIKYRGETNHPHDPADLQRCISYMRSACLTVDELRDRMAGRSPEWDALLPHWELLTELVEHEAKTRSDGRAPATYGLMKMFLRGAR